MSHYKLYPEYKDSGVAWLGEVPAHWEERKLKWVFVEKKKNQDTRLPPGAISFGEVVFKNLRNEDTQESYQELLKGEFIINPLNLNYDLKSLRVALSDKNVQVSPGYIILSLKKEHSPRFLRWMMYVFDVSHMKSLGAGIRQTITFSDIGNSIAMLPSIEEQCAIGNHLDRETIRIDTLITKKKRFIELLKERRQALVTQAVTKGMDPDVAMKDSEVEWLGEVPEHWEVKPLKLLVAKGSSISYGIVQPGEALDDGVPFVQTTNMTKGSFSIDGLQKTSEEIASAYPRSSLQGGEVLLGIRASIGAAHIAPDSLAGANLSRGVARIECSDQLHNEFLLFFFKSKSAEEYWWFARQGSTFNEVSIATVKNNPIPIPSADEQREIVAYLKYVTQEIDLLIEKTQHSIDLLKERRAALITAAVTGKIDLRSEIESKHDTEVA